MGLCPRFNDSPLRSSLVETQKLGFFGLFPFPLFWFDSDASLLDLSVALCILYAFLSPLVVMQIALGSTFALHS